jgi:hypothetical protein
MSSASKTPILPKRYRLLQMLKGHRDAVMSVAFSTDGRLLASGGEFNVLPVEASFELG